MSKSMHRSLEAKLASLDGPEWDTSDEEDAPAPTLAKKAGKKGDEKKKGTANRKNKAAGNKTSKVKTSDSSVIYLGHLPPAFEDGEIKGFLSQFGVVKKVRVSRSKKTGHSRGYGFVEFIDPQVAAIVAETMSGYFLMDKRLVCHVVPLEKIHEKTFMGWNKPRQVPKSRTENREQTNKPKTEQGIKRITARLMKREVQKREQLKKLGIEYDFPGYAASSQNKEDVVEKVGNKRRKVSTKNEEKKETKAEVVSEQPKSNKKKRRKVSDASLKEEIDPVETTKVSDISVAKVEKSAKTPKSLKKKRKGSVELAEETPKKKPVVKEAKTAVRKSKRKTKSRRDSVP
jgi:nucleolar protein 15